MSREVQICDGSVRAQLTGSSESFVCEETANQLLVKSAYRAQFVDIGAIADPSIDHDLAREVIRSSGRLPSPPNLLLSARVSMFRNGEFVPFEKEVGPILQTVRDLRNNRYSNARVVGAVYAGTDPSLMERIGDTWSALHARTACALSVLKSEDVPRILVTQSAQSVMQVRYEYRTLCETAIEHGVEQIWVADTRPQNRQQVVDAIEGLRDIVSGSSQDIKIGFMGTGKHAVLRTKQAMQHGADVVYGVEENLDGFLQYAEIHDLRALSF